MPSKTGAKASARKTSQPTLLAPAPASRSGSLLTEVIQKIEDSIADGRLVLGQRLVEADLTAQFGVSRSIIREALRLLAGEGVVELTPHRGCRIKQIDPQRLVYMLEVYSALFRSALEALVSKPITREARAALKEALEGVIKASRQGSIRDKINASVNYHFTIALNCGNPYFAEALERLHFRHYNRHEEIRSIHDQLDLVRTYKNAHARILKRDLASARSFLNPMMAKLGEHRREEAERAKSEAKVVKLRGARN